MHFKQSTGIWFPETQDIMHCLIARGRHRVGRFQSAMFTT